MKEKERARKKGWRVERWEEESRETRRGVSRAGEDDR